MRGRAIGRLTSCLSAPASGLGEGVRVDPTGPGSRSGPYSRNVGEGVSSEVAGRGVYALCSGSEREERGVHGFLDGLVRSTKTVMTRVELGGTCSWWPCHRGAPAQALACPWCRGSTALQTAVEGDGKDTRYTVVDASTRGFEPGSGWGGRRPADSRRSILVMLWRAGLGCSHNSTRSASSAT